MPSTVKIRVMEARDLPIMNRSSNLSDAFVEIRFANQIERTDIQRRTLNPVWKQDFRFNVIDDSDLQNEPLVFRVMDHDVYSADDLIGTVYIGLGSLLCNSTLKREEQIYGWFPIYDTLCGIRGELSVVVKVAFTNDENPFKNSSAGVSFFAASSLVPSVYQVDSVLGFIEELVVESDPEHDWNDNFRSARKSNESRQNLLYNLSHQVARQIGRKVLEQGGNCVLGYTQTFDLEGDSGLVARGSGTACSITYLPSLPPVLALSPSLNPAKTDPSIRVQQHFTLNSYLHYRIPQFGGKFRERSFTADSFRSNSPRDSASELSVDVRHSGLDSFDPTTFLRKNIGLDNEVVLLTINAMPLNVRFRIGGIVASRAVKFLGRLAAKIADQETRDMWWAELREEIKSHAKSLHCQQVFGYVEDCVVYEDVCILSAYGTAACLMTERPIWSAVFKPEAGIVSLAQEGNQNDPAEPSHLKVVELNVSAFSEQNIIEDVSSKYGIPKTVLRQKIKQGAETSKRSKRRIRENSDDQKSLSSPIRNLIINTDEPNSSAFGRKPVLPCAVLHVPFRHDAAAFANMRVVPCGLCNSKWVPEVTLATIERPATLPIIGHGVLIESRYCRQRPRLNSKAESREADALVVSENLVFLEIELHKQLIFKLKMMGMNAAFSLRTKVQIGARLIIGVATATAVFCPALPPPAILKIQRNIAVEDQEDRELMKMQMFMEKMANTNRERTIEHSNSFIIEYKREILAAKRILRRTKRKYYRGIQRKIRRREARKKSERKKKRRKSKTKLPVYTAQIHQPSVEHSDLEDFETRTSPEQQTVPKNDEHSIGGFLSRLANRRPKKRKQDDDEVYHNTAGDLIPLSEEASSDVHIDADTAKDRSVWSRLRSKTHKGSRSKQLPRSTEHENGQDHKKEATISGHHQRSLSDPNLARTVANETLENTARTSSPRNGSKSGKSDAEGLHLFNSLKVPALKPRRKISEKSEEASSNENLAPKPPGIISKLKKNIHDFMSDKEAMSDFNDDIEYGGDDEADVVDRNMTPTPPPPPPSSSEFSTKPGPIGERVSAPWKKQPFARQRSMSPKSNSESEHSKSGASESSSSGSDSDSSSTSSSSSSSSSSTSSSSSSSSSTSDANTTSRRSGKVKGSASSASDSEDERIDKELAEQAENLMNELKSRTFVIEIDDEVDEDLLVCMLDKEPPPGVVFCNAGEIPRLNISSSLRKEQNITLMIRKQLDESRLKRINAQLTGMFHELHAMLSLKLLPFVPCVFCGLNVEISIPSEFVVEIMLTGVAHHLEPAELTSTDDPIFDTGPFSDVFSADLAFRSEPGNKDVLNMLPAPLEQSFYDILEARLRASSVDEPGSPLIEPELDLEIVSEGATPSILRDVAFPVSEERRTGPTYTSKLNQIIPRNIRKHLSSMLSMPFRRQASTREERTAFAGGDFANSTQTPSMVTIGEIQIPGIKIGAGIHQRIPLSLPYDQPAVEISTLPYIPGYQILSYLGRLNLHFIRESWSIREDGGEGEFFTLFFNEAQAIARAHVTAIGGNAMLSFQLAPRESTPTGKTAYNVISISGDIVVMREESSLAMRYIA